MWPYPACYMLMPNCRQLVPKPWQFGTFFSMPTLILLQLENQQLGTLHALDKVMKSNTENTMECHQCKQSVRHGRMIEFSPDLVQCVFICESCYPGHEERDFQSFLAPGRWGPGFEIIDGDPHHGIEFDWTRI